MVAGRNVAILHFRPGAAPMILVIPTGTDAPIYHWPYATVGLIVLNVAMLFVVPPVRSEPTLDDDGEVIEGVESVTNFERYALAIGDGRLHPVQWVTHNFLHYGILHLAGNMLWLYYLGTQIEFRRGSLRLLAMVLAIAVISNFVQYTLGGMSWRDGALSFPHNPNFGGMSGVVFGLFGYTWMKMRFEPEAGLALSQQAFLLSLLWLAFCFTGLAGSVASSRAA